MDQDRYRSTLRWPSAPEDWRAGAAKMLRSKTNRRRLDERGRGKWNTERTRSRSHDIEEKIPLEGFSDAPSDLAGANPIVRIKSKRKFFLSFSALKGTSKYDDLKKVLRNPT